MYIRWHAHCRAGNGTILTHAPPFFSCPSSSIPTLVIHSFIHSLIHYVEFWHNLVHFSITYLLDLPISLSILCLSFDILEYRPCCNEEIVSFLQTPDVQPVPQFHSGGKKPLLSFSLTRKLALSFFTHKLALSFLTHKLALSFLTHKLALSFLTRKLALSFLTQKSELIDLAVHSCVEQISHFTS